MTAVPAHRRREPVATHACPGPIADTRPVPSRRDLAPRPGPISCGERRGGLAGVQAHTGRAEALDQSPALSQGSCMVVT
jgi:hypothetical protein